MERKERVQNLKTKFLKEIDDNLLDYREQFLLYDLNFKPKEINETKEELQLDFECLIKDYFALIQLRRYLEIENSLNQLYDIFDKNSFILCEMDFEILEDNLIFKFLSYFESLNIPDVFPLLNDKFFKFKLISPLDYVKYEKKHNLLDKKNEGYL